MLEAESFKRCDFRASTVETGVMQDRTAWPLIMTVQLPH